MKRGKFIIIDGGEGAGKTTLLQKLPALFPNLKLKLTREPGDTRYAEGVHAFMLSEAAQNASLESQFALSWAGRHDHVREGIVPFLRKGISVICDRFDASMYAYQVYSQSGRHLEKLFWITRELFLGRAKPHLYIFLDVDPEVGLARVALRDGKTAHLDKRHLDFHQSVRKGLIQFFKKVPHVKINANQSLEKVEADFVQVLQKTLHI